MRNQTLTESNKERTDLRQSPPTPGGHVKVRPSTTTVTATAATTTSTATIISCGVINWSKFGGFQSY